MKLVTRVVAVSAVAALTLGTPTAAFAGGKGGHSSKGKTTSAQKASKGKAAEARKKADERRKKAEEARRRVTFPGTVTAVDATSVTISRKQRGVTVSRTFTLGDKADIRRDGVRNALPVQGDHAMVQAVRKDGQLVVVKVRASAPKVEEAPAPTAPVIEPGTTPKTPLVEALPNKDGVITI